MLKRISLDQITRNPTQPRQHFDQDALAELANSIAINGLKQPITVRPVDGDKPFMIVMGERRYRAHLLLQAQGKSDDILCHVRKMEDEEMHIDAILENLQREEVSPMEEAVTYQRMIDDFGFSPEDLAKRLGIRQVWRITDRLGLLGLTDDNRDLLVKGIITTTQGYHMARLSPHGQKRFLDLVKAGLVNTNKASEEAADRIATEEATVDFDLGVADQIKSSRPKSSAKGYEEQIDEIGAAIKRMLDVDGQFNAPDDVDTHEAMRCIEKIKALSGTIGRVQRELIRAASVSSAAA